jgi:ubiquinone/menaquinone biosynthesis C-methylase UbiE
MDETPREILAYYDRGKEAHRLASGVGDLEWLRVCDIVSRYLPPPPGAILDVGGGPGRYACWLAKQGHDVRLVDPVPLHVRQALEASAAQPEQPLASAVLGDARRLNQEDASADLVLLFGPLYHLTERADRVLALSEAYRVLRPGGRVLAIGISRFASAFDGLLQGTIDDPEFADIVERDLRDGQHRNPTRKIGYFTTAYFHLPEELRGEVQDAGFVWETTLAVQGPAWLVAGLEARLGDPERKRQLLDLLRRFEAEPTLLGLGAHLLCVGRRTRMGVEDEP